MVAPDTRRFMAYLGFFAAYCGGTAIRLLVISDEWRAALAVITPTWIVGQERRHRNRAAGRRGDNDG